MSCGLKFNFFNEVQFSKVLSINIVALLFVLKTIEEAGESESKGDAPFGISTKLVKPLKSPCPCM